jgi:hypothetical protein
MKHFFAFSLLLAAVTSLGCSAKGPRFEPVRLSGDQAALYVYRPSKGHGGSGVDLKIKVDDQAIGKLKPGGYLVTTLAPGSHLVSSKTESDSEIPFTAEANKSYYVEAVIEMGVFVGRPNLRMQPEEIGKLAILSTRLSSDAKGPEAK